MWGFTRREITYRSRVYSATHHSAAHNANKGMASVTVIMATGGGVSARSNSACALLPASVIGP